MQQACHVDEGTSLLEASHTGCRDGELRLTLEREFHAHVCVRCQVPPTLTEVVVQMNGQMLKRTFPWSVSCVVHGCLKYITLSLSSSSDTVSTRCSAVRLEDLLQPFSEAFSEFLFGS